MSIPAAMGPDIAATRLAVAVQAVVDQMRGMAEAAPAMSGVVSAEFLVNHERKLSIILQEAIDAYTAVRGELDVADVVQASADLIKAMR